MSFAASILNLFNAARASGTTIPLLLLLDCAIFLFLLIVEFLLTWVKISFCPSSGYRLTQRNASIPFLFDNSWN